jgi:hypothetical protein
MQVGTPISLATALLLVATSAIADEKSPRFRAPITLSKATTLVTGPLTRDGYVDYASVINQRLSVGVTAENNANVLLWRAFGPHPENTTLGPEVFKLMKMETLPETGNYFLNLGTYMDKQLQLDRQDPRREKILKHRTQDRSWTAADYPGIATWLEFNAKPLALVTEATSRSRYYSPLISRPTGKPDDLSGSLVSMPLPAVQNSRSFARALTSRSMLHLGNGRHEAAWQDLRTCHRLGRLVSNGPTLIHLLVGIAIDGMACDATLSYIDHVKPDARQATRMARQLAQQPAIPSLADRVDDHERLCFLDIAQRIAGAQQPSLDMITKLGGNDATTSNPFSKALTSVALKTTDWDVVLKRGNAGYDQVVQTMRVKDYAARKTAVAAFERDFAKRRGQFNSPLKIFARMATLGSSPEGRGQIVGDILLSIMLPGLVGASSINVRAIQTNDNLQVALALSAYHAEQGKYPTTLADLKPKYLKELPIDRFSGKALIYQPTQEGYLFYSVGPNEKDDQGRTYDDEPPGDDLRVQMPRKAKSNRDE